MILRAVVAVLLVVSASSAGTSLPMGSLTTFGPVRLSGVAVPSGTTVFSGDIIETGTGSAVFNFREGNAVTVGVNSSVRVSGTQSLPAIEVVRGMSRLQVHSKELKLIASNWVVQSNPDAKTGRTTAVVLRDSDGVVSLNVNEGELVAKSTTGKAVYVAQAGRPVLLPAHPSALPSDAPANPPQAGGSGSGSGSSVSRAKVIGAYVLAAAAIGVGAAALASRDDSSDLRNQVTSLAATNAALQRQTASLLSQLTALTTFVQTQQVLLNSLTTVIGQLNAQQQILASIAARLTACAQSPGSAGCDPASLATLAAQQGEASRQLGILVTTASGIIIQINNIPKPISP